MNTSRLLTAFALALNVGLASTTAEAKTCVDKVTAKARSKAQVSDTEREARARDNAISNWSRRARSTHGYLYSFWWRADEKDVQCAGGDSDKHCTATAKPCRLY